jgi:hypothetical protein
MLGSDPRGELQMHVKLLERAWAMRSTERSYSRESGISKPYVRGRHTHTVNVRTLFENCVGKARNAVGAGPFTTWPDVSYCDP